VPIWVLLASIAPAPAASDPQWPAPEVARQIEALLQEKSGRSLAQRKLSSRLIYADRMRRGVAIAANVYSLHSDVEVDEAGRVLVDVSADVSDALLARIEAMGGAVVSSHERRGAIRMVAMLDRLEDLAADSAIRNVRPADRAYTRAVDVSEGDSAHRADLARNSYGIDGAGVTVGVLSDGVDSLVSLVASGDLPAGIGILPGQAGSGSEGTAMLEIVHDLAPGASLLFATAFGGQAFFASNILALRNAGADVIVDDVGYFAEAVFQDDDVASAVDDVVADGALYFSAAGNGGNLNDGTSGVWEGDFNPGQAFNGGVAHDYGAGDITNEVVEDSPSVFTLQWSDALGVSDNDYDLFLTNRRGTVLFGASTDLQDGAGDPFESIGSGFNDAGRQLIIVRSPGSQDRYIHLNANRGRLEHVTAGQISGHAAARGAIAAAAVDARGKSAGFDGTESVETFSSDGPRRVFFEADGSAITPGDLSSSGGELRSKPDLAAADCVSTATPGFDPFCGTSAAAPHAAAIAALLIERAGGSGVADPSEIDSALRDAARDIEAPGDDRDAGAGIADAFDSGGLVPEPECLVAVDCDDGLYCNGLEACDQGMCVAGVAPVCEGATPLCDESSASCVACLAAADCDDGLYCNGLEACDQGTCLGGAAPVCDPTSPLCDEISQSCVQCLIDDDCGAGLCLQGICTSVSPIPFTTQAARFVLIFALAVIAIHRTRSRLGA
jgi:hypothetical protein